MKKSREGARSVVTKTISLIIPLTAIFYITNGFEWMGFHVSTVGYASFILGLVLTLAFLTYPARKGMSREGVAWYDLLLIVMSLSSTLYIVFFPDRRDEALLSGTATKVCIVASFILVIAILEATRRMVNTVMAIIAALFVLHLFIGPHLPGIFSTFPFSLERVTTLFYFSTNGIFGLPVTVAFTIIAAFLLLGSFFENSGAGRFITDLAFAVTGHWAGGPAKAAVIGSSLLGTMTGATVANIVTTGTITIPLMKKNGFSPNMAGAVECCASNGGQIMPPVMGITAFLIAEILGMPYSHVCLAAIFPALLYYLALFVQIHFHSLKTGLRGLPRQDLPSVKAVFKEGWFYLIPIFVLIYCLAGLHLPVQHCGLYSALSAVVVAIIDFERRKETRKNLREWISWFSRGLEGTSRSLLVPAVACAAAGLIIGSIDTSGFGFRLSNVLVKASGGNLFFLLVLTAVASFILGMGMTSIPCYLILVILVAPAMVKSGVVPMAAHLFVFYWGIMSFITPPVAVGAYVAAGIAKGEPMRTGYIAMRLAFVSYVVPFVFVYNPGLLLAGSWNSVVWSVITASIGVIAIAIAFEGFLYVRLKWIERAAFFLGGLMTFVPTTSISWTIDAIGIAIVFSALFRHRRLHHLAVKREAG